VLVILIAIVPPAAAQIDASGRWTITFDSQFGSIAVETVITQRGARLVTDTGYAGTIDSATGAFVLERDTTCCSLLPNGGVSCDPVQAVIQGTIAPGGATFAGTFVDWLQLRACIQLTGPATGVRTATFACGNGVVEPGETCDDANRSDGDGCSAGCIVETCWTCTGFPSICTVAAAGSSCPDDGNPCTDDACTGTGVCAHANNTAPCPDDGNPCTDDACNGAGACAHVNNTAPCGDAVCETGACSGGRCVLTIEAAGTPCDTDADLCSQDVCDGGGSCVAGPALDCGPCSTCRPSTGCVAQPAPFCQAGLAGSKLDIRTGADPKKRKVSWRWRGSAPGAADFGNPLTTSDYSLCVYLGPLPGGTATATLSAHVPADGTCDGDPCWRSTGSGYSYRDRDATPDGVTAISLSGRSEDSARIVLKGKGMHLPLPTALQSGPDVTALVQLRRKDASGQCWSSQIAASTSTSERFTGNKTWPIPLLEGRLAGGVDTTVPVAGHLVAYLVSESAAGRDLNGDGDTFDTVLHVYDAATTSITNVGFAAEDAVAGERTVAFRVPESSQGADLNGDGDLLDTIILVFDPTSGTVRSTGLAGGAGTYHLVERTRHGRIERFVVAQVAEFAQGTDLNGDGDMNDLFVTQVFDVATGTVTNSRLASAGRLVVGDGFAAFSVLESEHGDLDGDGDANDTVLHIMDLESGAVTNVGYDDVDYELAAGGSTVAFSVAEAAAHADLNGDGDQFDEVLHLLDVPSGTVRNVGLSAGEGTSVGDGFVAFRTWEAAQGHVDLNGDGDTDDYVVHVVDPVTGAITNLRLALGRESVAGGSLLAIAVNEAAQGATDLNGDGDTGDDVLHVFDAKSGTITNVGLASTTMHAASGVVVFDVSEEGQGSTDLNGDGDTLDSVPHVFVNRPAGVATTGFANQESILFAGDGLVAFDVQELDQGDLNGDGDVLDRFAYVALTDALPFASLPSLGH
jgi:cysteine-rich repeat protein